MAKRGKTTAASTEGSFAPSGTAGAGTLGRTSGYGDPPVTLRMFEADDGEPTFVRTSLDPSEPPSLILKTEDGVLLPPEHGTRVKAVITNAGYEMPDEQVTISVNHDGAQADTAIVHSILVESGQIHDRDVPSGTQAARLDGAGIAGVRTSPIGVALVDAQGRRTSASNKVAAYVRDGAGTVELPHDLNDEGDTDAQIAYLNARAVAQSGLTSYDPKDALPDQEVRKNPSGIEIAAHRRGREAALNAAAFLEAQAADEQFQVTVSTIGGNRRIIHASNTGNYDEAGRAIFQGTVAEANEKIAFTSATIQ